MLTLAVVSATEKRPASLNVVPHGSLTLGSVRRARPGTSEIRLDWTYPGWGSGRSPQRQQGMALAGAAGW
ncbi:MAG TPA: hypothetical protein VFW33_02745 [Gemmataceae bacterium]|nr:hypothetical protein [Gemmataceae bacterium]